MAIDRTWLERVPAFDAAFGAGYGEEVDWCLRTAALGAVHLGHMGLVVEHSGAASFGQGNKATRIAAASSRIRRRHPGFPRTVTRWVEDDPLGAPRLALALAWAGTAGPGAVPVHVAHSLGGGTELWLARRLAEDLGGPAGAAVVLRLGGGYRWRIEVHGPAGITAGRTDDAVALAGLLDLVGPRRLVVSSVVGDADPTGLPALLLGLAPTGTAIDVMLHDHLALSPSFALLDADSGFRGVPPLRSTDPAHRARRPDGRVVGLPAWRTEWGRLLDAAAERGTIVAFSAASRDLVAEAYPGVSDRIRVRPHELADLPAPLPPVPPDARPVLGILGNLAPHKGAGTVAALARRLAALAHDDMRDAPRLVLIGTVDPAFRLVPPARVHGAYTPGQIGPLARRYGITHWLIPSICPETFSFTTREALATGRQVLVFDLGAQAEAARAAPNGRVLPLCASDEARAEAVLAALRRP